MAGKNNLPVKELPKAAYAGVTVSDSGFFGAIIGEGLPLACKEYQATVPAISKKIVSWLSQMKRLHNVKIVGVGLVEKEGWQRERLGAALWLKHDIVPHLLSLVGPKGNKQASRAARDVSKMYDGFVARPVFGSQREIIPSFLTEIDDFEFVTKERDLRRLLHQAECFKRLNGKIVFFSSTPSGGGVALMRHALIRLLRLYGVDAHWHVLSPKKEVFHVTKHKFHNILQAVAPKNYVLSRRDKKTYLDWINENVKIFRTVFKKADVIVIDDPQPSGLIPFIKKENPKAKIIYRSHIELRTDLMRKAGTQQHITWNFLKGPIHQADVFVSHPIASFVPKDVPKKKVVFMPATTDSLDGLNKNLSEAQRRYYQRVFNQYLLSSGQTPLSTSRPYIIQIARFDPSKGIPDVIETYRRLRKQLSDNKDMPKGEIPQLVIIGNGAIDDPEGSSILQEALFLLDMDRYRYIAHDIKMVRVPHIDQVLNALLSGSSIALQLSHREGFEVKVTEAFKKGKPVIAYRTGGIPLQIRHGMAGYFVRSGDTKKVAEYL